mmetsp:Transcript_10447/g.31482  ORF Transcript_10447/g.31482 Transcript_10447/m.31482 type:complete len:222 (+) Transcript_10447:471-1136(+)|eukprot:CAMPEP_0206140164 /NCGR_PEP_ID=MMETSP1473-20131121/8644_1 /ASSEMBLY_ACC=CAM_ASM_001109 /TAXON_ID=1461547 /ORGANISM="Stichococcus sp, Strain RCC1054" /LENGTH=221 /DNA_ID=CAMNT_0053534225 /DNA_START=464 /DNA_END=1129 /DNA_ORIENTATION=+
MARADTAYLLLYNLAQSIGWATALVQTVLSLTRHPSGDQVYSAAGLTVRACQGLAALEIFHAAAGLVRGSPVVALLQWAGRSNCLYAVLHCIPQLWPSSAVAVLFLAWSLSEVVRYPWYATSLAGGSPAWLTWARYTLFIPLYPAGVAAEMWVLYSGLPWIASRRLHSLALPNSANFAFDYHWFTIGLLVIYLPVWFNLYSYMLSQRRKKVGKRPSATKTE